jgi:4-diphosphocytidyl-2-C-methyl-D-erythritol kinase
MQVLTVPAPAKLNLFLHVTGRRGDGYHELETLFVALDFGDTITLTLREDGAIVRPNDVADVPEAADLGLRAARQCDRALQVFAAGGEWQASQAVIAAELDYHNLRLV